MEYNKGIALFLAVIFMSVGLAIALGISDLVVGEFRLAKDMRDSQRALYAADSGIECMLQGWRDAKWETPTTPAAISCFGQSITMPAASPGPATIRNVLVNLGGGACVDLEVTRDVSGSSPTYLFAARGQTSCVTGARSVQVGLLWKQQ